MENQKRVGAYFDCTVGTEHYKTYFPKPLPPFPPIELERLYGLLDQANTALGRLDQIAHIITSPGLFIYMYVRKEAVLSSQIEGTQSSLSDLLLFELDEAPGAPFDDVVEVSNYVAALNHGLKRLDEGFPLSLRLIKEIHKILLRRGRGFNKQPGEFRNSQNWIGGTRPGNATFVPPSPEKLMEALDPFEKYLHNENSKLPVLVEIALIHLQFETIHPFLDGNGRVGRLLIILILFKEEILKEPLLYLSLYFKTNRKAYYAHLQLVREKGDWEEWIKFFLEGVLQTAQQATESASEILEIFEEDRNKIEENLGKAASVALRVHYGFQNNPITDAKRLNKNLNISYPAIMKAIKNLEKLKIIREITGKQRYRKYAYSRYLDLMEKGTDPRDMD